MNPEDRINELSFHKHFSKHDFATDCKVFKLWKDVFKKDLDRYDFVVAYYFDLQKRAANGDISMTQVQKRLYTSIVANLDREKAVNLPKTIIKHLGVRKAIQVMSASIDFITNTIPFTSLTLSLITDTLFAVQASSGIILNGGIDNFKSMSIENRDNNLQVNKKLMIIVSTDSAVGDGIANIYFTYKIITL